MAQVVPATYIEAPAGYGKTERLVQIVDESTDARKVLLLTHTRAGVAAIKNRLAKYSIASNKYEIATIASFCMYWCKAYPKSARFHYCLPYQYPGTHYYPNLYNSTSRLLNYPWMQHIIKIAYSQVIVDEYQDCTLSQHDLLIGTLGQILPMTILGDPLQGIFYFGQNKSETPCDLYTISQSCEYTSLTIPWRWKQTNPALGQWISNLRQELYKADHNGSGCNIIAPEPTEYISYIPPQDIFEKLPELSDKENTIAFIARNEDIQLFFNRRTGGRYGYHEKKDDTILTEKLKELDAQVTNLSLLFDIFKIVFSNIDKHLSTMQEKIAQQNFDGWKRNNYPDLLQLFKDLAEISSNESEKKNSYSKIKEILIWVKTHKEFSCVRFGFYKQLTNILECAIINDCSLEEAYNSLYTFTEEILPNKVSTRTVLSKGLEFDAVIIDISGEMDRLASHANNESNRRYYARKSKGNLNYWDVRNFYVAVSRAKKKIYFIGEPNKEIKLKEYKKPKIF